MPRQPEAPAGNTLLVSLARALMLAAIVAVVIMVGLPAVLAIGAGAAP